MNPLASFLFNIYRVSLYLYPRRLAPYHDQIFRSALDLYDDSPSTLAFWPSLFADLLRSALKEHILMILDSIHNDVIARPIFFHALTLGLILTLMGGGASLTFQQMLRRGANQPQEQMAATYASALATGARPEDTLPRNQVDLESSLEPFAIFYDEHGTPSIANAYLNNAIPAPPHGVFNYLRAHGTDTLTWQPQRNVRIAAVMHRISGPYPGFLLVGRSLRLVEEQESLFWRMAFIGWFVLVALLIAGATLLGRAQRRTASPA